MVIVAFEDMRVNNASLLTDGADDADGGPSVVLDLERHTGSLPHPRGALPHVEGGLVDVYDL
jgi:hypothetical protein